ncbi:MAG TPA: MraY family glycosyltransferase [Acidimicrobiales bacterium]|jgi:UDP-GlcNAc:undecaprenyl-phosphate GlcNAc-1-phosphate transferase|nr:MraY family glycosyltransferase [Acidimicrobiales bacterium]
MPDLAGYAFVGFIAAAVTSLVTPVVAWIARRRGWVVEPDDRRVHAQPTPAVGGLAMYIGFVVAMFVAWQLDRFTVVFEENSEPLGVVLAATLIFAVGFFDDLRPISAPAKVAGIAVAGLVLAAMGVTMVYFRIPFYGVVDIGFDWVPLVTILWLLGMTNAINLIDGLDGLAAGIVAIAAGTFFLYSQRLSELDRLEASSIGPLLAVLTLGVCVGFLPHNFNPARIFMGDGGALLLGLLMAASTSVVGGRADPAQGFSGQTYFFLAPLAIPLVILGVPVLDTLFAIVRRSRRRSGLATADKDHLHHRLMRLGHGQRRSVLILWLWTALLSGLVLYPTYTGEGDAFVPLGVAALALLLFTVLHPDVRGRTDDAAADAGS